jgi:hypothetical protein
MKIVINKCFGGFGLSDKAYEKLIEWGIPVKKYEEEKRNENGLYEPQPLNDGEIIFDRTLSPEKEETFTLLSRYWESWLDNNREHPLLVKVVEELKEEANNKFSKLKIVEIPDGTEYTIEEYDGKEYISEKHQTWD